MRGLERSKRTGSVVALLRRLASVFAPPVPVTLEAWVADLVELYRPPRRASSGSYRVLQACRDAAAMAGPGALTADLTEDLVRRLTDWWAEDRRAATVNGLLRGLRVGCNHAVARGWLVLSPFDEIAPWRDERLDPPEGGHRRALTRLEVGRLLGWMATRQGWEWRRLYTIAMMLAYAGLRRDECLRLEWTDLRLDDPTPWILVTPKWVPRNRRVGAKTPGSSGPVPVAPPLASARTRDAA